MASPPARAAETTAKPGRQEGRVTSKLYIRTFGCQMNEYDSDRIADVLALSEGACKT
ncbi:MAG: hypothetical protein KBG60_05990, partial [Anaerolineaceae bacterium]|nr:hypothetical protein [Anaerolineaceae bacterium]